MSLRRAGLLNLARELLVLGALAGALSCYPGVPETEQQPPRGPGGRGGGRGAGPGPLAEAPPAGLAPIVDSIPELAGLIDTVRAGRFDTGKMWTFEYPPLDYLRETYGFAPDSIWFRNVRLAALRIPGCSASFVSPNGLVLTNHHCAREAVAKVTRDGENLLRDGFFARTQAEERDVSEFQVDQLIAIRDVTEEVDRRLALAPASLRNQRREEIQVEIGERITEEFGGESAGAVVEIISLYSGARTSAYVFRRYENVKLVMAPELQIGFFGGDPDNFTYPRYNLDFAFFRVYDAQGNPLRSDPYFRWSTAGAREGDVTFLVGNPGSTSRLETLAQLLFRRDVSDRTLLDFVRRRGRIFQEFARANPQMVEPYDLENAIFDLSNSEKAYQGQIDGLYEPVILSRLRDREESLERAIAADSALAREYGGVFDRMAQLQQRRRQNRAGYTFIALGSTDYESSTLNRALLAYQYSNALRQAQPISVRNELRDQILAVPSKPARLDEELIQDRLQSFVDAYGATSPLGTAVLDGRSVEGAATFLRQSSVFADSARTAALISAATVPLDDPALRIVEAYVPLLGRFEQVRGQLDQQEITLAEQIGRARFAVYGTAVPPDATFSLRFADGVVSGYAYNGTVAPAHTSLFGLYERYAANTGRFTPPASSPWDLPARWQGPPAGLDLSTPLNFVSTSDIIGGNSGSPVINRDREVVGLAFDGNMESLPGSYIYLPERQRAVSVDVRGILHALDVVYDMDRIVSELTAGQPVPATGVGGARR
jgi:hypothetical protein